METPQYQNTIEVCFIDKFFVPKNSIEEFTQKLKYNINFVKALSGFIKSEAYQQIDGDGNLSIITIALWENQEALDNARNAVQEEYKHINFNPIEFYARLNIKLERGLYTELKD